MASLFLIAFPNKEDRKRALRVFLEVPATRLRLPNDEMAVTRQHIEALKHAQIPFVYLSPASASPQWSNVRSTLKP